MNKFRFSTIHFVMIGVILFGLVSEVIIKLLAKKR